MSIRPVDMQIAMPKAMETSRQAGIANARPVIDQQQLSEQIQRNVATDMTRVAAKDKVQGQRVDKDGRNKDDRRRQGQGRKRGGGDQEEQGEVRKSIDISL